MRFYTRISLVAALLSLAAPAGAVIVNTSDDTAYQVGAGNNPFSNVGSVNGASCVYLGDYSGQYWVLTAEHVGSGTTYFENGSSGNPVAGSGHVLNAVGYSGGADLYLYRIDTNPLLPKMTLSASTPDVGTSINMAGFTPYDTDAPTSYTDSSGTSHSGYTLTAVTDLKYGTNVTRSYSDTADEPVEDIDDDHGITRMLRTTFTTAEGSAQVYFGDSGGGVFTSDGTLVATILALDYTPDQPDNTVIFGEVSYMADIATYRDQIEAIVPEPTGLMLLGGLAMAALARRRRSAPRR